MQSLETNDITWQNTNFKKISSSLVPLVLNTRINDITPHLPPHFSTFGTKIY